MKSKGIKDDRTCERKKKETAAGPKSRQIHHRVLRMHSIVQSWTCMVAVQIYKGNETSRDNVGRDVGRDEQVT